MLEEIVQKLTKAQREAVTNIGAASEDTLHELGLMGLAWYMGSFIDFDTLETIPAQWELRQKGLAVRARLEEQGNG